MQISKEAFTFIIQHPTRYEHYEDPPEYIPGLRVFHPDKYFLVMKGDTTAQKCGKLVKDVLYFPSVVIVYSLCIVPLFHLILAVVKFVQFFIPKNYSKTADEILGIAFHASHHFTEELAYRVCCIFSLFISYAQRAALFRYSDELIGDMYNSNIVRNALKLHIDGFVD